MTFVDVAKKHALSVAKEAKEVNKFSIFTIGTTRNLQNKKLFSPPVRVVHQAICGNVIVTKIDEARKIAKAIDGIVDIILVDAEQKKVELKNLVYVVGNEVGKSKLLTFKVNDMTADAADAIISQMVNNLTDKKIAIIGAGNLGTKIALKMAERGAKIILMRRNKEALDVIVKYIKLMNFGNEVIGTDDVKDVTGADIIIGATAGEPAITPEMVDVMNKKGIIVDCGIGTICPDAIQRARKKGIDLFRLDMRAGFAGAVTVILETERFLKDVMGRKKRENVFMVAGGFIGDKGDIIVDNIRSPNRIIGKADGKGGVIR